VTHTNEYPPRTTTTPGHIAAGNGEKDPFALCVWQGDTALCTTNGVHHRDLFLTAQVQEETFVIWCRGEFSPNAGHTKILYENCSKTP